MNATPTPPFPQDDIDLESDLESDPHTTRDDAELIMRDRRVLEALLFSASEPLSVEALKPFLTAHADVTVLLAELEKDFSIRGVNLVNRDGKWAFRTAEDLGFLLRRQQVETRPVSRAALETLAIIAYHQPVTRAEIEDVRGVQAGKGTLDILMEAGWIKMRGRRRTPGRPVTYGTTEGFLDQFSLENLNDLPGLEELKGAGLLSTRLPAGAQIPMPFDGPLGDDEEPISEDELGAGSLDADNREGRE